MASSPYLYKIGEVRVFMVTSSNPVCYEWIHGRKIWCYVLSVDGEGTIVTLKVSSEAVPRPEVGTLVFAKCIDVSPYNPACSLWEEADGEEPV